MSGGRVGVAVVLGRPRLVYVSFVMRRFRAGIRVVANIYRRLNPRILMARIPAVIGLLRYAGSRKYKR